MQPTPQRSRGDGSGNVYTKAPSFSNSYEKKDHKRIAAGGRTGRTPILEDKNDVQ